MTKNKDEGRASEEQDQDAILQRRQALIAASTQPSKGTTQGAPRVCLSVSSSLQKVPMPDLLQLFGTAKKSRVVHIQTKQNLGKIYLRKGRIYSRPSTTSLTLGRSIVSTACWYGNTGSWTSCLRTRPSQMKSMLPSKKCWQKAFANSTNARPGEQVSVRRRYRQTNPTAKESHKQTKQTQE
jgi:Domain of unknown function (DUF4388)